MYVMIVLGRLRQDLHDTDASLGYTKRDPVLKSQEGKNDGGREGGKGGKEEKEGSKKEKMGKFTDMCENY